MIDDTDREILNILQSDARTSNAEIARRVGMAPSGILARIRRLEEGGVIQGYAARLAPGQVGLGLLAFVFVRASESARGETTGRLLARIPEVQEVHHVAGEDCYLLKVRAPSTEALGRLLREQVGRVKTVISTRTTIVLGTVKETEALPLSAGPARARANGRANGRTAHRTNDRAPARRARKETSRE